MTKPINTHYLFFLRKNKKTIILSVIIWIILALIYLRIATPVYKAEMTIAPAEGATSSTGIDSVIGQLRSAGLSNFLPRGLSLGKKITSYDKFIYMINTHRTAKAMQGNHQVLQKIFKRNWDTEKHIWKMPNGLIFKIKNTVKGLLGLPEWAPPDNWALQRFIENKIKISFTGSTVMRKITFVHEDREFSQLFLQQLFNTVDSLLRNEAHVRISNQIKYIGKQIESTVNVEHRKVLFELLSQLDQKKMMLSSDLSYAASLIQKPIASDVPVSPKPRNIVFIFILLGLFTDK